MLRRNSPLFLSKWEHTHHAINELMLPSRARKIKFEDAVRNHNYCFGSDLRSECYSYGGVSFSGFFYWSLIDWAASLVFFLPAWGPLGKSRLAIIWEGM